MLGGWIVAAIAGLLLGAVVNVLADRLPALRAKPDTATLEPGDDTLEPVGEPARRPVPRYIVVEGALAVLGALIWVDPTKAAPWWVLLLYVALFALIMVIDIEHRLILNAVMLPAFAFALLEVAITQRVPLLRALAGYAVAQIVVMGLYLLGGAYLWVVNRGREKKVTEVAFGFGDVTLATFCGLVVGYPSVVVMLVLMILLGGLFALIYLAYRGLIGRSYAAHTALPYGPAIATATLLMLLWGKEVARIFGAG